MLNNNSLYGSYRQLRFTDVFPDEQSFLDEYGAGKIQTTISNDNARTLYYLLYGQYGNSTIAASDINRFRYQLFSIVFAYGPTWEKRLEIQKTLRELTPDELLLGSMQINNQAAHTGQAPTTQTLEELPGINEQYVTKRRKDKLTAYGVLAELLKTDVTMDFIAKFKRLFITIVQPEMPLWYATEVIESND